MTVADQPTETEARRALVLHDRPPVVDLIRMTLNHGVFLVRTAGNLSEAKTILDAWPPDMAVVDMDHDDSSDLLIHLGAGVEVVEHDAQMATVAGLRLVQAQVDRARRIGDDVACRRGPCHRQRGS